jgi:hypothetical protein
MHQDILFQERENEWNIGNIENMGKIVICYSDAMPLNAYPTVLRSISNNYIDLITVLNNAISEYELPCLVIVSIVRGEGEQEGEQPFGYYLIQEE